MPAIEDLALWTPVALGGVPPAIDWADLRGVRFVQPFFDQTVDLWAGGDPAPLVRTDLAALAALDGAPSLDPSLVIFHLSRCRSTLLSRLLSILPGVLAVTEPAPLNALLGSDLDTSDPARRAQWLRVLVRALGRRRFGDERHYILKLSSWNIRQVGLFRRAFPEVPWIWVQREPAEVMASLLANPAGWMRLHRAPLAARAMFGAAAAAVGLSPAEFVAQALAAMLASAEAADPDLVIDYRDLPEAAWSRAAALAGIPLGDGEITRMRDEAAFDAKDRGRRPFAGDPPERRVATQEVRQFTGEIVAPLYRRLDSRRPAVARPGDG